ncbi:MAG: carboxylating nicotinate-nucleotide diphosphorylase [Bdellovibrionales bacterium]|nr:carboxylating nicotinate-nucleotide diphosphorylase [Bdellovibrionales bacterium]
MTIQQIIELAYQEDIPHGDITTNGLGLSQVTGKAHLIAKEDLVLSGKNIFEQCLKYISPHCELKWYFDDGDFILDKQTVCLIEGNMIDIIQAERVALNFLGHLSGIATLTKCFVKQVEHTKCKILDTRKTLPLYRSLEKTAVVHGGGQNHRMNLSDAILIKENHIEMMGGLSQAVKAIRSKGNLPIEVEVKTLEEVKMSVSLDVHRLLLDNMDNSKMKECLDSIPPTVQTEASGNMNLERVRSVAELGVDFISVGSLTHSAPCADFSLIFKM